MAICRAVPLSYQQSSAARDAHQSQLPVARGEQMITVGSHVRVIPFDDADDEATGLVVDISSPNDPVMIVQSDYDGSLQAFHVSQLEEIA